jgi:recombination protein RecA
MPLADVVAAIRKSYKKEKIQLLGDALSKPLPYIIKTGIFGLDWITGIGGLPGGRIIEVYAPESVGKTSLGLQMIASAQRRGFLCAYHDIEHALSLPYATTFGCTNNLMLLNRGESAEEDMSILLDVTKLSTPKTPIFQIFDSIGALAPESEMEGEDSRRAAYSAVISPKINAIKTYAERLCSTIVFMNQIREKPGVMFGNPEYTPGGKTYGHSKSIRVEIRPKKWIEVGADKKKVGYRAAFRCTKNKVGIPYRHFETDFIFNRGFSSLASIIDIGTDAGIIKVSKGAYTIGARKFADIVVLKRALLGNKEFLREVVEQIR